MENNAANNHPAQLSTRRSAGHRKAKLWITACLAVAASISVASCSRSATSAPAAAPTVAIDSSTETAAQAPVDAPVDTAEADAERRPAFASLTKCAKAPVEAAPVCSASDAE